MDITALKSPEEGGFISKEDFTTPEPPKPQDTLLLQYPALADKINTALQNGVNRDVLRERLAQCESLALTQYNPSEINNYLGRTEKTQNAFYDAMKEQKDNSYVEIMRHKMPEGKVRDVVRTAALSGFDPGVLLMRPEILSIAEEIAGERRSTAGTLFYAAPRNMMAGLREGDAGEYTYEALELKQVLDDDYLLLKEGQREYELGRSGAGTNPTEEELKELGRQSYLKRIEDWEKKAVEAAKDAKAWKTSVRLPDGFTGTVYNAIANGGFTIKSAIRSAVAWQLGGPVGGFFMSMANTFSEAHSEAGRALLDELERSGDEKKALEIANGVYKDNLTLLPTTNYGGDFLLHGANNFFMDAAAELIPGGGILSKIGRGLFRVGVPMVLNSIPEGVEEYMQELFPMERAGLEIDERRLNEAAKMGFIDSILYSAVGLGSDAALRGIRRITPSGRIEAKVQKVLKETLKDSIDLAEKIDSGEIKLDDVIAQDPIVFIPKSKITEEIAQALNIESETTENNEEIINPEKTVEVSETPDAINVKEVAGEEAAAIESETAPEDEEIAIKKEDWEKFAAENPEQAQTLQANVREGINGITAEEQLKRNMNKMRQTVFDNSEAKIEYDRLVKELTEAGRSKEEAERLLTIAGAVAIAMNKQYKNISIRQAMNLSAIKSNEQIRTISRQAESHNQPLNSNVDLDTDFEVEPVQLTGEIVNKEDLTKKLRELLNSSGIITKDNLGYISLGSNKKIKHVIHSSRSAKALNSQTQELRGRALSSIQDLIKNSVLVESIANKKNSGNPNVENYHRFYTPIATTDGNYYAVRIVAEEGKNGTLRPIQATLYDLILEGKKNVSPLPQRHPSNERSIVDLHNEKLKITLRDLLGNVKDSEGNFYITPDTQNDTERESYNQAMATGDDTILNDKNFDIFIKTSPYFL